MQQGDHRIEKPSTIRIMYWESLIALRLRGVQVALVVFGLLLSVAIVLGVIRTQARQNDVRFAEQENRMVKEVFGNVLQGTLDSAESNQEISSRQSRIAKQLRMTARSPYLVSHASNLWDVSLFPSPLAVLSVGASQAWPDRYRIHGVSLAKTLQRNDQIRPATSTYGPFDVAFVVMAIAPLVVIGLTFNVSSYDRESALQNLIVAQTLSLGKLMAVRCFVRVALVIGLVIFIVNGGLLIAFGSQFDLNVIINLAIWNVLATVYLLVWSALSLFVNSFAKTSSTNGAALLLLWLVLVLLIPKFVSNSVQAAVPTHIESELAEREQATFDQASKNADGLVKSFQAKHPEIEIRLDDDQQMTLVRYLLAHNAAGAQAADNVSSHYSAQSSRATYLNFCDWVSPAVSFRNQSDLCSGNSEPAFIAFSVRAANVQSQVMEVFLQPSITNQECTIETMSALPSFQTSDIPKRPSLLNSISSIASMLVWLAILVSLGTRRVRVTDLNKEHKRLPHEVGVEGA